MLFVFILVFMVELNLIGNNYELIRWKLNFCLNFFFVMFILFVEGLFFKIKYLFKINFLYIYKVF